MAPRSYDRRRRDEAMAETRSRIVEAVADLHAEIGPSRTTYAMIAKRAEVAIPTVYNHFPNLADLFAACIGHVSANQPPLTSRVFADCIDAPDRLAALITALFERHRQFAPWLRWSRHELHLLPDMAVYFDKMRDRQLQLVREALEPTYGPNPPVRLIAIIEALTSLDAWETMTVGHGLTTEAAAEAVIETLKPVVFDQPTPG